VNDGYHRRRKAEERLTPVLFCVRTTDPGKWLDILFALSNREGNVRGSENETLRGKVRLAYASRGVTGSTANRIDNELGGIGV
jgi:hypothetical protein